MKKLFLLALITYSAAAYSSDSTSHVIYLSMDSIEDGPHYLHREWRFLAADDSSMSSVDFDDSRWKIVRPSLRVSDTSSVSFKGIGWFRLHITADSSITDIPLALTMTHYGASQIYFDGKLIKSFGKINGPDSSEYEDPQEMPFTFIIQHPGEHVFAVRYANYDAEWNNKIYGYSKKGFQFGIGEADRMVTQRDLRSTVFSFITMFLCGIFLALSMLHLFMFLYYRRDRSNLFFSIFMFCLASGFFIGFTNYAAHGPAFILKINYLINAVICIACVSLSGFIHELFVGKKGARFWIMVAFAVLVMVLRFLNVDFYGAATIILISFVSLEAVIIILSAIIRRKKGARIIGAGFLFFTLLILTIFSMAMAKGGSFEVNDDTVEGEIILLTTALAILSMPVSMSLYQAWKFSSVNKNLSMQLDQVKILSEKTIEQEKEKKRMLENRKEELEKEVKQRTAELNESHEQLIQQEKLASLGQLTAGIAHEIKNPLNFVTNFSELSGELIEELESAGSEEERSQVLTLLKGNLEKIKHHGRRADGIVQSMLQHARSGPVEKQLTDINKLCEEFVDLAYHGMRANYLRFNCEIIKSFADGLPKVNIVPQDISRVLLNILNNAFYAVMKRSDDKDPNYKPVVSLSTLLVNQIVTIKIRDNGKGIPEQTRQRIFEPFFTSKPAGEGTGLGLSICYDIMKAHGGEIKVESRENEYTEFVIHF